MCSCQMESHGKSTALEGSSMTKISKPVRDILVRLLLDWVPLDLVVGAFHFWSPNADASAIRSLTLDGISIMLKSGFVSVGDLGPHGEKFRAWSGDHEEIIAKVRRLWPDGTAAPNIEIVYAVWLEATPAGSSLANSLVDEFNQDCRASE